MSDDWGKGYDVGQAGMLQAIKTAEQLATQRERDRIIKLLEDNAVTYNLIALDGKILEHTAPLAAPLDKVIALIKKENK